MAPRKKKTTKKSKSTALAKKKKATLPTGPTDYGDDADAGFENMGREEFAIPFLRVLQKMSGECERNSGIVGAEEGAIFNTVTQKCYGEVVVIPCHRSHTYIEWIPREKGGGLVDVHDAGSQLVMDAKEEYGSFGVMELENGHELIETYSIFALQLLDKEAYEQVIINFSSTQIKAYKQWMTRASGVLVKQSDGRNVRPPLFAHAYRLTTIEQRNDKGSWCVFQSEFANGGADEARLATDSDLYLAARGFRLAAKEFAAESLKRTGQEDSDSDEM
jgi:hypothetical protein